MKRYKALLATTWWLWLMFAAGASILTAYAAPEFVILFPLFLAIFFYFALVRFDGDGNRREDGS